MERKRITCPETGHLEEIEFERAPIGLLITGCSRFEPRCALDCPRECARRMDRREHRDRESRNRVLLLHAGQQTLRIAEALAAALQQRDVAVDLAVFDSDAVPPLADYDGVVIGALVQLGRAARVLGDYLRTNCEDLARLPGYLFVAGHDSALSTDEYIASLSRSTSWRPAGHASFSDSSSAARLHELAGRVADELAPRLRAPRLRTQPR